MKWISDMHEGDRISDIYLCKTKVNARTKNGKSYYSLVLQDKTGVIDAKIWDLSSGIEHFDALDYVHIDGEVTVYQGSNQLNIRRLRRANTSEYNASDFVPVTPYDRREMAKKLNDLINSVQDPWYHELLAAFFQKDRDFAVKFVNHSAAKSLHHGFMGGLLQHTLSVTLLCDFYCTQYPRLNRDLLITGALCHDIGKVRELSPFPKNDYTDEGQLIGHIVIGYHMVMDKIQQIPGFPEKKANELGHLILAHHGELEFGSPKKPELLEAIALNFADNTDAKLEMAGEILDTAVNDTDWLGFQRPLDSNFRKTSR